MLLIRDILVRKRIRVSIPLTDGSGSCYFPQYCNRQEGNIFFVLYFLKVHLNHFSTTKVTKKSKSSSSQGFSYYFCLMIERTGPVPLTNGSGSKRTKNSATLIRTRDKRGLKFSSDYSSSYNICFLTLFVINYTVLWMNNLPLSKLNPTLDFQSLIAT